MLNFGSSKSIRCAATGAVIDPSLVGSVCFHRQSAVKIDLGGTACDA